MNLFKKLVKVCTTWRSSSSASSDKEQSQRDYITDQWLKEHMVHSPLMNSPQMWTNNTGHVQSSMLGSAYNPNTMTGSMLGSAYNPNTMTGAMRHVLPFEHTRSFTAEKVDNGFVLRSGSKAKVCKDMDELRDFFVSIMVEYQLDK